MLHAWRKFGYEAADAVFQAKDGSRKSRRVYPVSFRRVVIGKLEFVRMVKGDDDPVYLSLWNRLAAADPTYPARVRNLAEIEDALWVIECEYDAAGQSMTRLGTAFALEGYGLVTAAHCAVGNVFVYRRANPAQRFQAGLRRWDSRRDIAVLDVPRDVRMKYLRKNPRSDALQIGAELYTAGYPIIQAHFSNSLERWSGSKPEMAASTFFRISAPTKARADLRCLMRISKCAASSYTVPTGQTC
jgi:hypothetical protein